MKSHYKNCIYHSQYNHILLVDTFNMDAVKMYYASPYRETITVTACISV